MNFIDHSVKMMVLLFLAACSSDTQSLNKNGAISKVEWELLKKGNYYNLAREELLSNGWAPIAAACSEQSICLAEHEMATNLSTRKTCGMLKKNEIVIKICLRPVPDALLIESVELVGPANPENP